VREIVVSTVTAKSPGVDGECIATKLFHPDLLEPLARLVAQAAKRSQIVVVSHAPALVAALGVILGPLDLPAWIPVLGELDILALGILAVKVFVDACPEGVVEEHKAALKAHRSVFDADWEAATGAARVVLVRALRRVVGGRIGGVRLLEDKREDRSA